MRSRPSPILPLSTTLVMCVVALLGPAEPVEAREETRSPAPAPSPQARPAELPPDVEDWLGPAREPDATDVRDACRASRRGWQPGPSGRVRHRIEATPSATVYLGDICLGRTPLTLRPPRGARWRIEVRRAGHDSRHILLPSHSSRQRVRLVRPPPQGPIFTSTDDPFPHTGRR